MPSILAATILVLGLLLPLGAFAADGRPLLQEGKKSLYQRVISHPGARIRTGREPGSEVVNANVKPFSVFYVYEKTDDSLHVGASSTTPDGWIDKAKTTPWNQSLTLLFTPRTGRDPVLFFRSEKSLLDLCKAKDIGQRIDQLIDGKDDETLVAAEPSDMQGSVSKERFYIMPIMDMDDPIEHVKFLEVASIDPHEKKTSFAPKSLKTGIALVIDTSISMKPYIDQSLNLVRKIYDAIEKINMTENVGFAVTTFRSSTKATPNLGYVSKVVSDFTTAKSRSTLESQLAQVEQATVSSHDFNEDSLAGVFKAVDSLNWNNYDSRLILLVTDAGPLESSDPYKSVRMGVEEMNDFARAKDIWITVVHIKTPKGAKNHDYAEDAYRKLSRRADQQSYIVANANDQVKGAREFMKAAEILTSSVVDMVAATAEGKRVPKPKAGAHAGQSTEEQARNIAEALGYAMQLDFLGRQRDNQAPEVVKAWISDKDMRSLSVGSYKASVDVAVLLTKSQLSDLSRSIGIIMDNAMRTKKTGATDFFQGILNASTHLTRDPNMPIGKKTLTELGLISEFLEGLPYKSEIMSLNEDDWYRMTVGEQTQFINRLKSRLDRYREYDRDRDAWEDFGLNDSGDWVCRIPLNVLP
jgi:serine/threonine-protein kinase PpkA